MATRTFVRLARRIDAVVSHRCELLHRSRARLHFSTSAAQATNQAIQRTAVVTAASISNDIQFKDANVPQFWIERLSKLGFKKPTHTQQVALPTLMARHHAVLHAETGTGKTLCYLLPILDALHSAVASHSRDRQFLPIALVLVPNAELAAQVHRVAVSLYPEHANLIKPCYGQLGVTRRQNAGILIATPVGLQENVSNALLSSLQYVIFDEFDALLTATGTAAETVQTLLQRMKRMAPEDRPMHIFCAATLPKRGKSSVAAFLDKWYPEPEVRRIVTGGQHKPLPQVVQAFWQLDSSLPLTAFERQAAERLKAKMAEAARLALLPGGGAPEGAAAATEADGVTEAESGPDTGKEPRSAASAQAAASDTDEEADEHDANVDDEEYTGDDEDRTQAGDEDEDDLARTMAGREAEDKYLAGREEEKRYHERVKALRRAALLSALLQPARVAGHDVVAAGAVPDKPAPSSAAGAEAAEASPKSARKRDGFRPSSQLGLLDASPPPKAREVRAEARHKIETAIPTLDLEGLKRTLGDRAGQLTPALLPFASPAGGAPKLTAAQCALVPPTLVFVNTVAAAETLRTYLAASCPTIRVSELHSKVPDAARAARVADFASGAIRVLVATDLAARGLDTTSVVHVIQAEFAGDAVGYIHRVGRTARAGSSGMCTSLVIRSELDRAKAIINASRDRASFDAVFSRRRSFRKRAKRSAIVAAEEDAIMGALEREMKELQGQG